MANQGTALLDFGAFPGKSDASIAITSETAILSGSLVEAWIFPAATTDHSADEHLVDPPRVVAGSVVAGTGFTIYGFSNNSDAAPNTADNPRVYGKWNVAWVWN